MVDENFVFRELEDFRVKCDGCSNDVGRENEIKGVRGR